MSNSGNSFWYIASYPKSGNTWCRFLIFRYLNLLELKTKNKQFNIKNKSNSDFHINAPHNIGMLVSSRIWIDDQIGFESSDLTFDEIAP